MTSRFLALGMAFRLQPAPYINVIKLAFLVPLLLLAGCGKDDSTTAPSSTTPTPAAATVIERYIATIGVGGSGFYSFTVPTYGNVELTLNAVSGVDGPDVTLGIGLGGPRGRDCSAATTANTAPGTTAQLTSAYTSGVYCARVFDVGNLTGPTTFNLTIAHP